MYRRLIEQCLAAGGCGVPGRDDPRLIEAWMRLENENLDALSPAAFRAEVSRAVQCMYAAEPGASEALAASYGL